MKRSYKSDITLGERYVDKQTGIEGVATAIHFYQHACERVTLEYVKPDRTLEELGFDAPRLTSLKTGLTAVTTRTGGPARAGEKRTGGAR
jgi:hypothetical protein